MMQIPAINPNSIPSIQGMGNTQKPSASSSTGQITQSFESMLTSLKSTLDNLDRLVGSLRDDPARLLFAKPPQSVIPQGGQP